jgi:hypothetical protein
VITREIYVDVEIDVYCAECGHPLEWDDWKRSKINVTPCNKCIQEGIKEAVKGVTEE